MTAPRSQWSQHARRPSGVLRRPMGQGQRVRRKAGATGGCVRTAGSLPLCGENVSKKAWTQVQIGPVPSRHGSAPGGRRSGRLQCRCNALAGPMSRRRQVPSARKSVNITCDLPRWAGSLSSSFAGKNSADFFPALRALTSVCGTPPRRLRRPAPLRGASRTHRRGRAVRPAA